jgi:endonuclease YncB( thermonuclease family)
MMWALPRVNLTRRPGGRTITVPQIFWSREHGDACVAYVFRSAVQGKVCAALVLVAAGLLLTGPSASAARPGNDNYAYARATLVRA